MLKRLRCRSQTFPFLFNFAFWVKSKNGWNKNSASRFPSPQAFFGEIELNRIRYQYSNWRKKQWKRALDYYVTSDSFDLMWFSLWLCPLLLPTSYHVFSLGESRKNSVILPESSWSCEPLHNTTSWMNFFLSSAFYVYHTLIVFFSSIFPSLKAKLNTRGWKGRTRGSYRLNLYSLDS